MQVGTPAALRWGGISLFTLGCVLLVSMAINWQSTHSGQPIPDAKVDLTEVFPPPTEKSPLAANTSVLRVAIAPVISPEESLEIYDAFVEYLGKQLKREAVFLHGSNYAHVNNLVRYEQCDLAMVCSYAFVQGERDFGMKALVVPRINGKTTYQSFIVIPFANKSLSLLDLKGKKFGSADMMSTSGWLYPRFWLRQRGENPKHFFSAHVITGSHDCSVYAVASGLVDGAAVDSLVYEQMIEKDPELKKKISVIDKSPPFGMPPLVISARTNPDFQQEVKQLLLRMKDDPEGKVVLAKLGFEGFEEPAPGLYDGVKKLVNDEEAQNE